MKRLSNKLDWEDIYRRYTLDEIPWEIERPDWPLKRLVESGGLRKGVRYLWYAFMEKR